MNLTDLDFKKVSHKYTQPVSEKHKSQIRLPSLSSTQLNRQVYFILASLIITFALGIIVGIIYQEKRMLASYENYNQLPNISSKNKESNHNQLENKKDKFTLKEAMQQELLQKINQHSINKKSQEKASILEQKAITKRTQANEVNTTNDLEAYHILVKQYNTEKEALYYGNQLNKLNLDAKVFLTKSGEKYKVYIGPIIGKDKSYQLMQVIKSIQEFKSAILYKN